jgi:hypothetical protein
VATHQVSISPTFYARLFRMKVLLKYFSYLYVRYELFLVQDYLLKCTHVGKIDYRSKVQQDMMRRESALYYVEKFQVTISTPVATFCIIHKMTLRDLQIFGTLWLCF